MSEQAPSPDNTDLRGSAQFSVRGLPLHLRIMSFVFGVMFLLTLVICGHLMWTAEPRPGVLLERFFAAVESGRAEQVLALCDPALGEQIDKPRLAAWLAALKQNLGALQTVTEEGPKQTPGGGAPRKASPEGKLACGTGRFEHGSVYAELRYEKGRLTELAVRCDELPPDWCSALR